jgi:hypothetical protein
MMEHGANTKLCLKMGKIATETFQLICRLMVTMFSFIHIYLNGLSDLKVGVQALEMQTQLQMSMKLGYKIVSGLSKLWTN